MRPLHLASLLLASPVLGHDLLGVGWDGDLVRLDSQGVLAPQVVRDDMPGGLNSMARSTDGRLFAVAGDDLIEITSPDGDYVVLATLNTDIRGLAYSDDDDAFYAIRHNNPLDQLIRIDLDAGDITFVGNLDSFRYQSLAVHPQSGNLFAWEQVEGLKRIDRTTAAVTDNWDANSQGVNSQFMAFRPNGRLMIGRHDLYRVSLNTGEPTLITNLDPNFEYDLRGLEVRPGVGNEIGQNYCGPAAPNSTGQRGRLMVRGVDEAGGWFLGLTARSLPPGRFGWFLASPTQGSMTPKGAQGSLCLGNAFIGWGGPFVQYTGDDGRMELCIDTNDFPGVGPVMPGDTWNFQAWYRDENPGFTSNFTQGVSVEFGPTD